MALYEQNPFFLYSSQVGGGPKLVHCGLGGSVVVCTTGGVQPDLGDKEMLIEYTTLQCMMNAKLSLHGF